MVEDKAKTYGTRLPDRSKFEAKIQSVTYATALSSLHLPRSGRGYLSSFKIDHIAQAAIGLSALSAALVDTVRNESSLRAVEVHSGHASVEYRSNSLYTLNGERPRAELDPIGGLHETSDGYVRVHDALPNHRNGMLKLLNLSHDASRNKVAEAIGEWPKLELERAAYEVKLAVYALRTFAEWDALPQAKALPDCPNSLLRLCEGGSSGLPAHMLQNSDRCLRGLRVLELSRVIAAPVAGRTLAAHGADVLWVTPPNLPSLPALDVDTSRGKRTVKLDLNQRMDHAKLVELIQNCDVFLQSYRPGALVDKGFGPDDLVAINPNIIYANLSAFGTTGPWADRRGFDSLVQTCSGMNVSEATYFGNFEGEVARPLPCQALDHTSGYFLATGIAAAMYKRATEGGAWQVDVSLAGTMKYLRSLGQVVPLPGIGPANESVPDCYFEKRECGFGMLRAVRHAASIEGAEPGWDYMPKPLGSDEPQWL
ncbi:hypothetical protein LTR56_013515 [Elasticomyces elasticus]|nr:hypothetical protein LTR56_013515 [Elasticomyces elasticus]KAK3649532.1 hypothetical protein LTR22_012889 [Elasticomyces elasticus]KAK4933054.1 hypothetical protein LTR49_000538 [Elasticomyces elasticus]KAK5763953.1 hypothetical protein LTS12_005863 [Elasticomyces elasticus]